VDLQRNAVDLRRRPKLDKPLQKVRRMRVLGKIEVVASEPIQHCVACGIAREEKHVLEDVVSALADSKVRDEGEQSSGELLPQFQRPELEETLEEGAGSRVSCNESSNCGRERRRGGGGRGRGEGRRSNKRRGRGTESGIQERSRQYNSREPGCGAGCIGGEDFDEDQ
jgi:hypothetical protein